MDDEEAQVNAPEGEMIKQSNVFGFTVVMRAGKRPRSHLLRPYESCNTDDALHKQHFEGSMEQLAVKFGRTVPCLRCFPGPTKEALSANDRSRAMSADDDPSPETLAEHALIGPESIYTEE